MCAAGQYFVYKNNYNNYGVVNLACLGCGQVHCHGGEDGESNGFYSGEARVSDARQGIRMVLQAYSLGLASSPRPTCTFHFSYLWTWYISNKR